MENNAIESLHSSGLGSSQAKPRWRLSNKKTWKQHRFYGCVMVTARPSLLRPHANAVCQICEFARERISCILVCYINQSRREVRFSPLSACTLYNWQRREFNHCKGRTWISWTLMAMVDNLPATPQCKISPNCVLVWPQPTTALLRYDSTTTLVQVQKCRCQGCESYHSWKGYRIWGWLSAKSSMRN